MPGWNTSKWQRPQQWSTLRKAVLERDCHQCNLCGAHATHVDHRHNQRAGGNNHPDNLQALCLPCHRAKTAREGAGARSVKMRHPAEQHPAQT